MASRNTSNTRKMNESHAQTVEKPKVKRNKKKAGTLVKKNMINNDEIAIVSTVANSTSETLIVPNEALSKKENEAKYEQNSINIVKVDDGIDCSATNCLNHSIENPHKITTSNDFSEDPVVTSLLPILSSMLTEKSSFVVGDLQISKSDPHSLEYLEEMITHSLARESELSALPNDPPKYDLTEIDRSVVIKSLVKFYQEDLEQLEAGVRLFDCCNGRAFTPLEDLYLLGTTCIWVAEKLVGRGPPRNACDMAWSCDGPFGPTKLLHCEQKVLRLLDFPAPPVVAENYLQYILRISEPERPQVALSIARKQLTAALYHPRLLALPPSRLAAAAVAAALRVCGHRDWSAFWTCRLCHPVEDIMDLENELLEITSVSASSAARDESSSG